MTLQQTTPWVFRQYLARRWFQHLTALIASLGIALLLTPQLHAQSDAADSKPIVYVVDWGDSLSSVAQEYSTSVEALVAANGLASADAISAGQRLIIPATSPNALPVQALSTSGSHTVKAGENLYRISLLYGVTTTQLMAVNNLVSSDQVYAGQELAIPGEGQAVAATPTETPTQATTEQPSDGQTVTHIVQPGELLGNIASRYDVSTTALIQANNITNPSLIYVGQVLSIPGTDEVLQPQSTEIAADFDGTIYVVERGDTLFRIALNNSVTMDALMAANSLTDASTILVGQALQVPSDAEIQPAEVQPAAVAEELEAETDVQPGPEVVVEATPAPVTLTPEATLLAAIETPMPTTQDKEIVVDLSQQTLYAYEAGKMLRSFVISSGLPVTPTVLGTYNTYLRYDSQRMYGPGYDLPGVPWVQYFYLGYAIHGTYWHNNFGQPMSHGCINMRPGEAKWLYDWAPMGVTVTVQQ